MHNYLSEFLTIAVIHLLAVASPGPDFAVMLRQSIRYGRMSGIWTSIGIGVGIFVHITYCILGLGLIISKSILAFNLIKYLGAFYLIYIGFAALRSQKSQQQTEISMNVKVPSPWQAFVTGFITNALNPKATLFFLAVFSVTVSPSTPVLMQIGYGVWMVFATIIWFGSLSLLFSKNKVRSLFANFGHWFDRVMGAVLIGLGVRLAFSKINN